MSRTVLNFVLDACLLFTFTLLSAIGVVLRFVFPPATQAEGWTLWSWSYDDWSVLWFNVGAFFALLVLFHVMLHWSWVCGVVAQRLSKVRGRVVRIDEASQTIYGVGLLIVVLLSIGIFAAAALFSIRAAESAAWCEQKGHAGGASAEGLAVNTPAPRTTDRAPVSTTHHAAARSILWRKERTTSEVPSPNSVSSGTVPAPKTVMTAMPPSIVPLLTANARNA